MDFDRSREKICPTEPLGHERQLLGCVAAAVVVLAVFGHIPASGR
jgi:hypothetical protein